MTEQQNLSQKESGHVKTTKGDIIHFRLSTME